MRKSQTALQQEMSRLIPLVPDEVMDWEAVCSLLATMRNDAMSRRDLGTYPILSGRVKSFCEFYKSLAYFATEGEQRCECV